MGGSISQRKLAANRANALLSTGPRTARGKATSRRNAIKHGLLSEQVLLPGESPRQLAALCRALDTDLKPVGAMEELLVDLIASGWWRLRRSLDVERRSLMGNGDDEDVDGNFTLILDMRPCEGGGDGHSHDGVTKVEKPGPRPNLPHAQVTHATEVTDRYQVTRERQIYQALHELQRLQAARGATAAA